MPPLRSIRIQLTSLRRLAYRRHRALSTAAGVLLAVCGAGALRAETCPTGRPPLAHTPTPQAPSDAPSFVHADDIRSTADGVSVFRGHVDLARGPQHISADLLRYDRNTGQSDATGNVVFSDSAGTRYEVPELHLNLDTHVGHAAAGSYRLAHGQGRGDMQRVEFQGRDHTRLVAPRYTACPAGRDDWFVRAREIELDTGADIGVARHARVEFLGVPVFYLPYFTFPISDERKSGFLVPQVGFGNRHGMAVAAPYYWNIAPNYDATLTPRVFTDRGLQLQTEFRYLGRDFGGRFEGEYLPDDERSGENRAAGTFVHSHAFTPGWTAAVDLRGVSDKDYLSEFGDRLHVTSQTHLPQDAQVNYRGALWYFTGRVSDYQTVDKSVAPTDRPYARLPQLLLGVRAPEGEGLRYRFDSELVNFERSARLNGQRAHANPAVSLPLVRPYGFITPEVGAYHIEYHLQAATEDNPSVTAPYFALDSGVFFERTVRLGANDYVQTLEPRLYYLRVPFRDQNALPNFDTTLPDFSFANLFRTNRFVGGDRIGDANQATFALTTRFLNDADGGERLRASVGQIRYFDDRRVNLPAATAVNDRSDLAAEAVARLAGSWYASGAIQWNAERDQTQRSSYYFQYQPAPDRIVNVGHRFIRNEVQQIDVSGVWPLSPRWTVSARSLYSQHEHRNIDSYAGLQYNACCWAARLYFARRLVQAVGSVAPGTEDSRQIMFELELSGLARLGAAPESPLRQGLFGFPTADAGTAPR